MVEIKPKIKQFNQPKKQNTNNTETMYFKKPTFLGVVVSKNKGETSYIVSKWLVEVQVGHFYKTSEEDKITEKYQPLEEGQKVGFLKIKKSGKFFNLVDFGLEEVGGSDDPQPDFFNEKLFAVCVVEDLYNLDNQFFEDFTREYNKKYNRNLNWKEIKDKVMNFKVGKTNINFSQLGYGYHFLPVDFILKLFRYGFENFCLVHGLFKPDGFYIHFKDGEKPKNYSELVEKIKELKGELNV